MNKRIITAAALVAGLLVQTQGFTQVPTNPSASASTVADAGKLSNAEKAARKTWHAVMKNIPVPGEGCFHAKYPNVAWERVECKATKPRVHHAPPRPTGPAAGNGNDWMAQAHGLIYEADGKFFISGVTSETNVATPSTPSNPCAPTSTCEPVLGSNEYSLQINTNNGGSPGTDTARAVTPACNGHPECSVWQQFIYATDEYCTPSGSHCGQAALFIQYWLLGWNDTCPAPNGNKWSTSMNSNGDIDCYINVDLVPVPDIPVTNLGDVILAANVTNGGYDYAELEYGDDSWASVGNDSSLAINPGVDIASVWTQAEFNVVGDLASTEAQFSGYPSIIVVLAILDGSNSAPTCVPLGATGETNNLTPGACQTGVGNVIDWDGCGNQGSGCVPVDIYGPYIEFPETKVFRGL